MLKRILTFSCFVAVLFIQQELNAQTCTTLGQTPSTAFPVCGTLTFTQLRVPICSTPDLYVPGCDNYPGYNPFFYKFTCYQTGTLGFTITPLANNEDYDWQLYDITGKSPDAIFTDRTIIVTGNWAGTYAPTGASATGVNKIECGSDPTYNIPTFSTMPTLIAGHAYLLLVSHFNQTDIGYKLSFGGGTAVITDPLLPKMSSVKVDCDGTKLFLKLNKKMLCKTLKGDEFSILPAVTTVISAVTNSCSVGFDFDSLSITLASPLPIGNYQLVINNGTDGNTLQDICENNIPPGDRLPFSYSIPLPVSADSIGKLGCAPDSIRVYFPKRILCSSIATDGSDFVVLGPSPVSIIKADGICVDGKTEYVIVHFTAPIQKGGNYLLQFKTGTDANVLIDECGQAINGTSISFNAADTVNAEYSYTISLGCQKNTYQFTHPGGNQVNRWYWTFNNTTHAITPVHTINFPATSTNDISLIVSNGVCNDTATEQLVMSNRVKADFSISDSIICPEDFLTFINQSEEQSQGVIDSWLWKFGGLSTSTDKDPPPYQFPMINSDRNYRISLTAHNDMMNCDDVMEKTIRVLDHCLIEVPTAFTPNNDGLNDWFQPHNALKALNYHFWIFNRWGQLVFESRNWMERWDGKVNGQTQTTGVFVWMLSYVHKDTGQSVFRKGTVTLIK